MTSLPPSSDMIPGTALADTMAAPPPLAVGQLVVVTVKRVVEMGAIVDIAGHDREGFILLSELSRRRVRNINSLIHVGERIVTQVIRIDRTAVDLSKRRVSAEDAARVLAQFINH